MFLSVRELKYSKTKHVLIMLLLVLIIFLVLFLSGLAKGLSSTTISAIDNAAANYYILDDSSDNLITRSSLTEEEFAAVDSFLANVTPINLQRTTIKKESKLKKQDITYLAVDFNSFMMPEVIEGETLKGEKEIVLNLSFKEEGFKIGDKIFDSSSGIEMKVVGFTKDQMYGHSAIGVISLKTYSQIQEEVKGKPETAYHAFAVSMNDTDENYSLVENFLKSKLEETMLLTKNEIIRDIPSHLQVQGTILMMLVFLLVISSFIIGVFFYVTTMQKIPQFGVIKALGSRMSFLSWSLITQVLILSGISMIIGNILTFTIARMLPSSMPFVLTYTDAASVSLLFIIISIASSLFSIGKVRKVDAISAIGGN